MREFAAKVKRYYERGLWSEQRVRAVVQKGAISAEEYAEIVGKAYSE